MPQRPRTLTPEASPQHLFGALLRGWRQRRKLSQAQLGALVYVSGDLVAKVEKALRWPSKEFASRCDAALNTGGVLMDLLPLVDRERRRGPTAVADSVTTLEDLGEAAPSAMTNENAIAAHQAEGRQPQTTKATGKSGDLIKIETARLGRRKRSRRQSTPRAAGLALHCSFGRRPT